MTTRKPAESEELWDPSRENWDLLTDEPPLLAVTAELAPMELLDLDAPEPSAVAPPPAPAPAGVQRRMPVVFAQGAAERVGVCVTLYPAAFRMQSRTVLSPGDVFRGWLRAGRGAEIPITGTVTAAAAATDAASGEMTIALVGDHPAYRALLDVPEAAAPARPSAPPPPKAPPAAAAASRPAPRPAAARAPLKAADVRLTLCGPAGPAEARIRFVDTSQLVVVCGTPMGPGERVGVTLRACGAAGEDVAGRAVISGGGGDTLVLALEDSGPAFAAAIAELAGKPPPAPAAAPPPAEAEGDDTSSLGLLPPSLSPRRR